MFRSKVSQEVFEILERALIAGDSLSLRNIGSELNLAPNTILYHFKKLEEKGLIVRDSAGKVVRVVISIFASFGKGALWPTIGRNN